VVRGHVALIGAPTAVSPCYRVTLNNLDDPGY
jgi:hypothetical protein